MCIEKNSNNMYILVLQFSVLIQFDTVYLVGAFGNFFIESNCLRYSIKNNIVAEVHIHKVDTHKIYKKSVICTKGQ